MAHIVIVWLRQTDTQGEGAASTTEAASVPARALKANGVALGPFETQEAAQAALEAVTVNLTARGALRFYLGNGFLSTVLSEHFAHGATLELPDRTGSFSPGR